VLELPNRERNVADNVPVIREFVERVRGTRVPWDDVVRGLTVVAKERARLEFLQRLADGTTAS
jgi:hypothetical protein